MAEQIRIIQKKTFRTALLIISALATVLFGSGALSGQKLNAYQLSQADFAELLGNSVYADVPSIPPGDGVEGGDTTYDSGGDFGGTGDYGAGYGDHDVPGSYNSQPGVPQGPGGPNYDPTPDGRGDAGKG